jgi:uracil-DNA glycosylase
VPKLDELRKAAADCHACPPWKNATQTIDDALADAGITRD